MDRDFPDVVRLLALVASVALATIVTGCKRLPTSTVVTSSTMASGTEVTVYLRGYYDISLLGLEVRRKEAPAQFYFIAASPNVHFGDLVLRVDLSGSKQMLWISGSSRAVSPISAAYDDVHNAFFIEGGVARESSAKPDISMMSFDSAVLPPREQDTSVVFDGRVAEQ